MQWVDANTGNDDAVTDDTIDNYHKPTIVNTLGWIMKDDEAGITLVNEYYDQTFRGRTFIPRICVVTVTDFKLTKPPKDRAKKAPATNTTPSDAKS